MSETKRNYHIRSKEERIAEIDKKITNYKNLIAKLEVKREAILNPPKRKSRIGVGSVLKKAQEAGMTPEEIAEKLGLNL